MRVRLGLGILAGFALLLSGPAHAFLGWPPMRSSLEAAHVDPALVGALAVGWYFGSVAMLVFGVQVIATARRTRRGESPAMGTVKAIAAGYLLFGSTAFVARDFNPHFLFFVAMGVLVGAFAFWPSKSGRNGD